MAETRFNDSLTLKQMIEQLKELGCQEITRILPQEDLVLVEWE